MESSHWKMDGNRLGLRKWWSQALARSQPSGNSQIGRKSGRASGKRVFCDWGSFDYFQRRYLRHSFRTGDLEFSEGMTRLGRNKSARVLLQQLRRSLSPW